MNILIKAILKFCTTNQLFNYDFCVALGKRSNGNAFVSGAGGQRFKSRASQIGHSVANGSPPLQHFFEKKLCRPGAMTRRWAPQTRYTLRSTTASIMKEELLSRILQLRCL